MTIEEILQLEDEAAKIELLKKGRKTPHPDRAALYADWNPDLHEIFDREKYPMLEVKVENEREQWDDHTQKMVTIPAKTKRVEPNRIALPLEQDIVNIQTSFTVGTEPALTCDPDETEAPLLDALKQVMRKNKLRYQNRRIVRAWLAEQECAEYWFAVKDAGFWARLKSKLLGKTSGQYKLRSVLWSPFRGDRLYPFFDDAGDLVAFSREYEKTTLKNETIRCFMTITADAVYRWEQTDGWVADAPFKHGFGKLPVIYCYRPEAFCAKIRSIRVRLEKLLSSYADCIDYHFFPILKLFGETGRMSGEFKQRIVELTGQGADAQYLTWNQASDTVKLELDSLTEKAYGLTNTPRITFENLKGSGSALSGVAFRYVFMGAHMSVENHAEAIGDFMQRRVNFLVSAIGSVNPVLAAASKTIDVETDLVPYMIDDKKDKVATAVAAVDGGIWSRREGIVFAGNAERIEEELEEIEESRAALLGGGEHVEA